MFTSEANFVTHCQKTTIVSLDYKTYRTMKYTMKYTKYTMQRRSEHRNWPEQISFRKVIMWFSYFIFAKSVDWTAWNASTDGASVTVCCATESTTAATTPMKQIVVSVFKSGKNFLHIQLCWLIINPHLPDFFENSAENLRLWKRIVGINGLK